MTTDVDALRDRGVIDAERVVVCDTLLAKTRGVIGRSLDGSTAYVFPFARVADRGVHMVGVRRPLRVRWVADGEVIADERLRPWVGRASHRADCVVETVAE